MKKVIGKILFNLIIATAIFGMIPVDSLNQTLKSIVTGIRDVSSAAILMLAVALNEERRNKDALIKHLEGTIEFTKKNMDWFQEQYVKTKGLYEESQKENSEKEKK